MSEPARTIWRLTLEPIGADVAWSLLRSDGCSPAVAVDGGMVRGVLDEAVGAFMTSARPAGPPGRRMVATGMLLDPVTERDLARLLGYKLLPATFRQLLCRDAGASPPLHVLHVAVRGWLAQVPWEALAVDDDGDVRLVEAALTVSAMSPGIASMRARTAVPTDPTEPGLAVVDAGPPDDPVTRYDAVYTEEIFDRLYGPDGLYEKDVLISSRQEVSADELGRALVHSNWSRLFYLGHVGAGRSDEPAAAGLVLQRHGLPDLLTARAWLAGPNTWPAPARVALIGCGSDDSFFQEASGLPVAAVNAGALLVTCTRWVLPTDARNSSVTPTTDLALAVHRAHRLAAPIGAVRDWQLGRLAQWRERPDPEASPLYWAAVTSYVVPEGRDD